MTAESVADWCRNMPPEDVCDTPGCYAVATVLVTGKWRIGQWSTDVELGRYCPRHAKEAEAREAGTGVAQ